MLADLPWRSRVGLALLVAVFGAASLGLGRWGQARLGAQVAAAAHPGDIQMIGSTTCVYCAEARAWFSRYKVPYTECQVERDAACESVYRALQAPGTPVLVVRGQRLVGFAPQAVADALRTRQP